jgi:hypothetical protein
LKPKAHVICLLQCGGLWFVNGKISITWNLKQAIVQKPKQTMEGTCFLKPKAADVQKMKALAPVEDAVDPDGVSTTIVDDSDDEYDEVVIPVVAPVVAPTVVAPTVVASTVVVDPVVKEEETIEEVKPKKKIIRKKTDA